MAAIKQRDLNEMDRYRVDEFEITGRNTDTDAPSRMQASEMLAEVRGGLQEVDNLTQELDERVKALEDAVEKLPLVDVPLGTDFYGKLVTFENTDLVPPEEGEEQYILFSDGSTLQFLPGRFIRFNLQGNEVVVWRQLSGWLQTSVLFPDSEIIVEVLSLVAGDGEHWGFDSAFIEDASAIEKRVTKLEGSTNALRADVEYLNDRVDNDVVLKSSGVTQVINSNITLGVNPDGTRSGLFLERENGVHENAVKLGLYGTYEQEEHASESDPTCLNHCGTASDGTVVGDNIIVNYKSEPGGPQVADGVPYIFRDIDPLRQQINDLLSANYRRYGDLSATGGSISVTLGAVTVLVQRKDTTTLEVRATSIDQRSLSINHRYSGDNTVETKREQFDVGPTGTVIGTINVGQYVVAEFWTEIDFYGYDVVASSDDDNLTRAWVEVKRSTVIAGGLRSEAIDPYAALRAFKPVLEEMLNKKEDEQ